MPDDLATAIQALQDILREPAQAVTIAENALAGLVMRKMGVVACPAGRVPVHIPALEPGGAGWAKWVIRTDPKAAGGFMFDGPFLPRGQPSPLPPGVVVLIADGSAATKRRGSKPYVGHATAWIVQPNGELGGNPIRAHRQDWSELAERIAAYLKSHRELPLFGSTFPPAPPPPPEEYGPPLSLAPLNVLASMVIARQQSTTLSTK